MSWPNKRIEVKITCFFQDLNIHQVLLRFLDALESYTAMTCIGGVTKIQEDMEMLETSTPDVIIATPGRIDDLIKRSDVLKAKLKTVEMLIIDEADQVS